VLGNSFDVLSEEGSLILCHGLAISYPSAI